MNATADQLRDFFFSMSSTSRTINRVTQFDNDLPSAEAIFFARFFNSGSIRMLRIFVFDTRCSSLPWGEGIYHMACICNRFVL